MFETSSVFMDPSLIPFWRSRTMHGESVVFITSERHLVFTPDAVLGVTNAAGNETYSEGADYLVDRSARRSSISRAPAGASTPSSVRSDEKVDCTKRSNAGRVSLA